MEHIHMYESLPADVKQFRSSGFSLLVFELPAQEYLAHSRCSRRVRSEGD